MAKARRDSPIALNRAIVSDAWLSKLRRTVEKVLWKYNGFVVDDVSKGLSFDRNNWSTALRKDLIAAKAPIITGIAVEGFQMAELELGKRAAIEEYKAKIADVEIAFGAEEFVQQRLATHISEWLENATVSETRTAAKDIEAVIKQAEIDGETPAQMAKTLHTEGIVRATNQADRIARSTTIWAANEGAKQSYSDAGVKVLEWMTASDLVCEFCEPMDGNQIPIEGSFFGLGDTVEGNKGGELDIDMAAIEHPPLHPSCRCTIVPVL